MREMFKPESKILPGQPLALGSVILPQTTSEPQVWPTNISTAELGPSWKNVDMTAIAKMTAFDSDSESDQSDDEDKDGSGDIPTPAPANNSISTLSTPSMASQRGVDDIDLERESRDEDAVVRTQGGRLPRVPGMKRRKLDVSYRKQRILNKNKKLKDIEDAWKAVQKLLGSKKQKFESGQSGLQQRRTRAIECHLRIFLKNQRPFTAASRISAEAHRFSDKHGSRQLRAWTRTWIAKRELPKSKQGMHAKVYSLFNDPVIAAELRAFLRSNKWAMDPEKLALFTKEKLIPPVAEAYLRQVIAKEMPEGLKKYMEVVLFPRIHLKVGRGVSLSTARRWMHREGFRYLSYKKGLYFDGHDRPDVVEYRQEVFLPRMEEYAQRLVRYVVGDVDREFEQQPENFVERRLVLCAHDEMTAQAHDGNAKSWVLDNQHALRKKGVGRGIHQSDIICSTVGWLKDASQTLEYGKNYEGYWTGELFIKQVSYCIPKIIQIYI